ncbi:LysR family transcriptional regulator [Burkholderia cenocepacia]|uniref:LysR family transcriptional regulator n=2 Tax=Burkholderia cenocepacia TaxID=95486 RepID=UPI0009AF363B|nr:LysR family transcriptional regulator [Burkholderia cenocepacia]
MLHARIANSKKRAALRTPLEGNAMDRLRAMRIFVQVVDAGSFTGASESLGIPAATVTLAVKDLEQGLGVRLLNRTTRRSSLTQDGAAYYAVCTRVLAELDEAEAALHDRARGPRGRLRVDAPPSIAYRLVIPHLHEFRTAYPDIRIVLGTGDRPVDFVQEAVDIAIRVGRLDDSTLIARRLGLLEFAICGSPGYFARRPAPRSLADLAQHEAVRYFSTLTGRQADWIFDIDGTRHQVQIADSLSVNDADAMLQCGLHGLGLVVVPRFVANPYLASGELIRVLDDVATHRVPVSVVYPQGGPVSSKVRCFVDWTVELFARTLP